MCRKRLLSNRIAGDQTERNVRDCVIRIPRSFSADYNGVKGRKGQHGVGLDIKEAIVKNAHKGGIAIKCMSARLLKARISILSSFVTFVVAYILTEEAPEGQKTIYMAALKSTVASAT